MTDGSSLFDGLDPFADPLIGKDLGPYHIESVLGQGGMGVVYKAVHRELGKEAAVKVISGSSSVWDSSVLERFHQEALAYARIRHPNVVEIFESGCEQGINYLALEFIAGRELKEIVDKEGPQPVERILEVGEQLCDALLAIHAKGLVHRDIKLANLMVGKTSIVKLMDFGVVRTRVGKGALTTSEVGGTLRCMAPEVVNGAPGDSRSDIFQVGVLLYEMLSGGKADATSADFRAGLEKSFFCGGNGELRQDVPDGLKEVILRCVQPKPALRFQSAGVLRRELCKIKIADPTVPTRPRSGKPMPASKRRPGLFARTRKFCVKTLKNNADVLIGMSLCAVLLVMAVLAFGWLFTRSDQHRSDGTSSLLSPGAALSTEESFHVEGYWDGLLVNYDFVKTDGLVFRYSYRDTAGQPVFRTWQPKIKSGEKRIRISDSYYKYPVVSWKLERGKRKIAGGSELVGFSRCFKPQSNDTGGAFCIEQAGTAYVVDGAGCLYRLDTGRPFGEMCTFRRDLGKSFQCTGFAVNGTDVYLTGEAGLLVHVDTAGEAASSDLRTSTASEWKIRVRRGIPVCAPVLLGELVCLGTDDKAGGRGCIVGYDIKAGEEKYAKGIRGAVPFQPAVVGRHLLTAFNRRGHGVVVRLDMAGKMVVWKHILPGTLVRPPVVSPDAGYVYLMTADKLRRLRLLSKPLRGKRELARSLGDCTIDLPGTLSAFQFDRDQIRALLLPKQGERAVSASLKLAVLSVSDMESGLSSENVPLALADDHELLACPPPLDIMTKRVLAAGRTLCIIDHRGKHLFSLGDRIISLWKNSTHLFAALADGEVMACRMK